jgi:hypothetical protein
MGGGLSWVYLDLIHDWRLARWLILTMAQMNTLGTINVKLSKCITIASSGSRMTGDIRLNTFINERHCGKVYRHIMVPKGC